MLSLSSAGAKLERATESKNRGQNVVGRGKTGGFQAGSGTTGGAGRAGQGQSRVGLANARPFSNTDATLPGFGGTFLWHKAVSRLHTEAQNIFAHAIPSLPIGSLACCCRQSVAQPRECCGRRDRMSPVSGSCTAGAGRHWNRSRRAKWHRFHAWLQTQQRRLRNPTETQQLGMGLGHTARACICHTTGALLSSLQQPHTALKTGQPQGNRHANQADRRKKTGNLQMIIRRPHKTPLIECPETK